MCVDVDSGDGGASVVDHVDNGDGEAGGGAAVDSDADDGGTTVVKQAVVDRAMR